MRTNSFGGNGAFSFGFVEWNFLWNSTPCGNQERYLEIEIRHRKLEIISIWIINKVIKVDEEEMKKSVVGKKPKRVWYPHNQVKKVPPPQKKST